MKVIFIFYMMLRAGLTKEKGSNKKQDDVEIQIKAEPHGIDAIFIVRI